MRPQVVSKTTKHYDALIRAIEAEGIKCYSGALDIDGQSGGGGKFFVRTIRSPSLKSKVAKDQRPKTKDQSPKYQAATDNGQLTTDRFPRQSDRFPDRL